MSGEVTFSKHPLSRVIAMTTKIAPIMIAFFEDISSPPFAFRLTNGIHAVPDQREGIERSGVYAMLSDIAQMI